MKLEVIGFLFLLASCKTNHKSVQTTSSTSSSFIPVYNSEPGVIVYKTKVNYNNLVPVILSEDKKSIVSYPHPSDIKVDSTFSTPIVLNNNYLIDKRGMGKNVAYLNITYQNYAKLKAIPTLKELYDLIIDKDPLLELCDCGAESAFKDKTSQINEFIKSNSLRKICKVIK